MGKGGCRGALAGRLPVLSERAPTSLQRSANWVGPLHAAGEQGQGCLEGLTAPGHQCSERWLGALGLGPDTCPRCLRPAPPATHCVADTSLSCFPGLSETWGHGWTLGQTRRLRPGLAHPSGEFRWPCTLPSLSAAPPSPHHGCHGHGQRLRCPGDGQPPSQ